MATIVASLFGVNSTGTIVVLIATAIIRMATGMDPHSPLALHFTLLASHCNI